MKVLGNRVLVERVAVKKKSVLIEHINQKEAPETFDFTDVVIQLGPDVKPGVINIGDIPIFGKYATESALKIIHKDDKGFTTHLIMEVDNIVGIETPEL